MQRCKSQDESNAKKVEILETALADLITARKAICDCKRDNMAKLKELKLLKIAMNKKVQIEKDDGSIFLQDLKITKTNP
jgi:hypothetical protein